MTALKNKPFLYNIKGKVIAAFMLGCLAIALALTITYYSFSELMGTVDKLSVPNTKLQTLNNLFHQITKLDQQQRADAIKNPSKSYRAFLHESQSLIQTIDSLRTMQWEDPQQVERLNAMEKILHERDRHFLRYLKSKSDFIFNKKFSTQLDSLAEILAQSQPLGDTSVRTTQRKTVTTTYRANEEESDGNWLSRVFGKKKADEPPETRIEVREEVSEKIDTLAIAQQDSAIRQVGRIMKSLEEDQRLQNRQMIERELKLINTNTVLINQLLGILREVEIEELSLMRSNNAEAATVVNTSINRITIIMFVFFIGVALLIFLIMTDIARSNYYRQQLIRAKNEAEELGQVKQRFLANMSHEIRTPLQSILGFAEQLKYNDTSKEAIQAIQSSSEHLLHIVNEVLDFSRIESGKLTFEREPFHLLQIINDVSAGIRVQAEKKSLDFLVDISETSNVYILGDSFRLQQILYNLLGNAIKFTDKGYVKLVVKTTLDSGYTVKLSFQVIDSGIGMHPEDIERVFQQFEQAHGSVSRQYGGTGLGLTIVKKLIEAQNGQLHVESEPNSGTKFTVELLYDRAPLRKVKTSSKVVVHQQTGSPKPFHGKVLVVDDDRLILRLCEIILEKHGIPHISFGEPEKVLQQKLDKEIRLILLDIRMPHLNGMDLCQELRKQVSPDTRIIALTAHVLPQERNDLQMKGFDYVLAKPFREQELLDLMGIRAEAQSPPESAESNGLNLTSIREMTMGDETLLQSVIAQFVEETKEDIQKLDEALTHLETLAAREIIHKLAGRLGQMGLHRLCLKFKEAEEELQAGKNLSQMLEKIYSAKSEVEKIVTELQETVAAGQYRV